MIILIIGHVFLPLYTWYLWSDARHCEFYFVGCWLFSDSYKSWVLFRDKVKLLGNSLILTGVAFMISYIHLKQIIPHSTEAGLSWVFYSSALWIMSFSSQATTGNKHCPWPCVITIKCSLCPLIPQRWFSPSVQAVSSLCRGLQGVLLGSLLFPLRYSPVNASYLNFLGLTGASPQGVSCPLCLRSPYCAVTWKLYQDSNLGQK